jgi:hypothetical protein
MSARIGVVVDVVKFDHSSNPVFAAATDVLFVSLVPNPFGGLVEVDLVRLVVATTGEAIDYLSYLWPEDSLNSFQSDVERVVLYGVVQQRGNLVD